MKRRCIARVSILSLVLCWCAGGGNVPAAWAQSGGDPAPVLPGRPDADPNDDRAGADAGADAPLGPVFESRSAGIAFRSPAQSKQIRGGGPDEIVRFVNDAKKWSLRVSRVQFGEPLPLETGRDPKTGKAVPGLLDLTLEQFRLDRPGAEILREDVVPLADGTAGLIAARYSVGLETLLYQQALVRQSDRTYVIFAMTSPAPRTADVADDPAVRDAVQTFNALLDSTRLLDQQQIKEDQNQRLFRTRSLFLNMSETRIHKAMIKEQWMRVLRDGKDIGYLYVVEEVAADLPKANAPRRPSAAQGVRIGIRSRMIPEPGAQIDAANWMWMSFDKRHEQWSNRAVIRRGGADANISEFGASDKNSVAEARGEEKYTLNVTHITKTATAEPVVRELPVFYIPQALGHLLPRLVPLFEPKGYMFATYVSDNREVMARYVDVGREEEVSLAGGAPVRAIPIRDRIGLEGPDTTHYMSPEGKYLGSVDSATNTTIIPTDRQTLLGIWTDADLSPPSEVEASSGGTGPPRKNGRR